MPPKPPASTFAPTALGAALLGLSAALFAVDVGGTVVLDAPSGTPERTSANPPAAPAQPPQSAALPPAIVAKPAPVPISLVRHVYEPLAAARSTAVAPEPRPALRAMERRAAAQRRIAKATVRSAPPALVPLAASAEISLAPRTLIALAPPAPKPQTVSTAVRPKVLDTRVASLRDVRHFAMRRLVKNYPNISVISADTYSVGGNDVRVSMVVQNGSQRWVEKDVVKRSGTSLALEKSARHGMPYARASTPEPLTVTEPDGGP